MRSNQLPNVLTQLGNYLHIGGQLLFMSPLQFLYLASAVDSLAVDHNGINILHGHGGDFIEIPRDIDTMGGVGAVEMHYIMHVLEDVTFVRATLQAPGHVRGWVAVQDFSSFSDDVHFEISMQYIN